MPSHYPSEQPAHDPSPSASWSDTWTSNMVLASDDVTAAGQRWDSIDVGQKCAARLQKTGGFSSQQARAICDATGTMTVESEAFSPALAAYYSRIVNNQQ